MFSVVIPLYNKANYIEKCLNSVLNQTFQEFEVIVVNDGSTDDGLQIVNSEKLRLKSDKLIIIDQENCGVSTARNNGVKAAKYDYIAFLDADDWWDEHFLEEMKLLIEDFPDAGIYGSKYYWVKNGKKAVSINHENDNFKGYVNYIQAYIYAWWMPLTSISVIIRKEVFNHFKGFNATLKFGEDFELWIRVALDYKIALVNKPLAYYNQDISDSDRALGDSKFYPKDNFFLFNLDFLDEIEQMNHSLKILLDGLRVRSLQRYYLSGIYPVETKALLSKVDFRNQPLYYRFVYKAPLVIVKLFFWLRSKGSGFKQGIIKKLC